VFGHLEASKLHLRGGYGVRQAHFQVALRRPHMLRRGDDGLFPRLGSRVRLDRVDLSVGYRDPGFCSVF
jgi:hypothetical protein